MSRTLRTITQHDYDIHAVTKKLDETAAKHKKSRWIRGRKMKPYTSSFNAHYYRGEHVACVPSPFNTMSNGGKLSIDNANRSLKKGLRQQYKREIQKQLKNEV